jgi:hypothetical protein
MTAKREPLARNSKTGITEQMIDLYERGVQLVAEGHDDVDGDSAGRDEIAALSKKLEWSLLKLPLHCTSVFDPAIDGPPSSYLSPSHGMFLDWPLSQSWRRALQAALDARRRVP